MSVLPPVFSSRRAMSTLPRALDNGPCASANLTCRWRPFATAAETDSVESATELHPYRLTMSSASNINPSRGADPALGMVAWFVKAEGPQTQGLILILAPSARSPTINRHCALGSEPTVGSKKDRLAAQENRERRNWSLRSRASDAWLHAVGQHRGCDLERPKAPEHKCHTSVRVRLPGWTSPVDRRAAVVARRAQANFRSGWVGSREGTAVTLPGKSTGQSGDRDSSTVGRRRVELSGDGSTPL